MREEEQPAYLLVEEQNSSGDAHHGPASVVDRRGGGLAGRAAWVAAGRERDPQRFWLLVADSVLLSAEQAKVPGQAVLDLGHVIA